MDPQAPQYPQYPGTTLPIDPRREKRRSTNKKILLVVAFVVTFGAGIGIGAAAAGGSSNANASSAAPAPTVTVTVAPEFPVLSAAPAVTVKPTVAPKPKPPAIPTAIGDGSWQVGVDFAAGTYVGTVPSDSSGCYWERDKDASGSFDSIIANANINPGGHVTLAVTKSTKYVTLDGCGTLHKR